MFVFSLHLQFAEAAEPKPKPGETRERESSLPIITTSVTDRPTVPAQKRKESAPPELLTKASPNSSKKL